MNLNYGVAEIVSGGTSKSLKFFVPTRCLWLTVLKLKLYKWWNENDDTIVVTRVVDKARAEYLLVSYTEWALRQQIDNAAIVNY